MARSLPARRAARLPIACGVGVLVLGCSAASGPAVVGPVGTRAAEPAPGAVRSVVPAPLRVPPGHRVRLDATGYGHLVYECRAGNAPAYAWVPVAPEATLIDARGAVVAHLRGGPTWEAVDGSSAGGRPVAAVPGEAGAAERHLVRIDSRAGEGTMADLAWIQRLDTHGGGAPSAPCSETTLGERQRVRFQAVYVMWAAPARCAGPACGDDAALHWPRPSSEPTTCAEIRGSRTCTSSITR